MSALGLTVCQFLSDHSEKFPRHVDEIQEMEVIVREAESGSNTARGRLETIAGSRDLDYDLRKRAIAELRRLQAVV